MDMVKLSQQPEDAQRRISTLLPTGGTAPSNVLLLKEVQKFLGKRKVTELTST